MLYFLCLKSHSLFETMSVEVFCFQCVLKGTQTLVVVDWTQQDWSSWQWWMDTFTDVGLHPLTVSLSPSPRPPVWPTMSSSETFIWTKTASPLCRASLTAGSPYCCISLQLKTGRFYWTRQLQSPENSQNLVATTDDSIQYQLTSSSTAYLLSWSQRVNSGHFSLLLLFL